VRWRPAGSDLRRSAKGAHRAECRCRLRVAERPLNRHHATARRDQPARVEVPAVVQCDPGHLGPLARRPPRVADRVLMWRQRRVAAVEHPPRRVAAGAVLPDVVGKELDELPGQIDGALAAVLRCADLYCGPAGPLHLPANVQRLAEPVHVANLQRGGLTQT
jgi:hypothetical protein